MKKLYTHPENGTPAGLHEVCQWFIENYPEDIFTGQSGYKPAIVARMRDLAKIIMEAKP